MVTLNMKLFAPLDIRGVELKNRIVMSPMCMYSCEDGSGRVTDFHKVHYASRAAGQVGLIVVEATAVSPEGRISVNDLGLWDDGHVDGLRELVGLIRSFGSKAGIQIAHAGRKSTVPGTIIAPSAIAFNDKSPVPVEMDADRIRDTREKFVQAAVRAARAGFDVIEIHAAHGYLIHEFLSPLSNRREDEYGGSAANRFRFLGEIIEGVRSVWQGPLFVRISASDYHPEGLSVEDVLYFVGEMKRRGVDLIDCSSGGLLPVAPPGVGPGYQVAFSSRIRRETGILTGTVGMIADPWQAETILSSEQADLVFLGRELLRDPYWPRRAAKELGVVFHPPRQYQRGWV
jgi:NADPH2 dehydrogenase